MTSPYCGVGFNSAHLIWKNCDVGLGSQQGPMSSVLPQAKNLLA